MAEAFFNATEGSGKKFHAWDRAIGANNVLDEFTLPGEYPLASYTVTTDGSVAVVTAASHLLQIMAGASLNVRVRKIRMTQGSQPGAVTVMEHQVLRLTTAGTGGTAKTPRPLDTADAAAGATAMTLPTAKGTEGSILYSTAPTLMTAAIPGANVPLIDWLQAPNAKPILIAAGTSNGIAVKNITGVATATVYVNAEITETSFV